MEPNCAYFSASARYYPQATKSSKPATVASDSNTEHSNNGFAGSEASCPQPSPAKSVDIECISSSSDDYAQTGNQKSEPSD